MSKARKILIVFLGACMSVCLSVAAAACDKKGNYPDYKNPADAVITPPDDSGVFTGRYTVKVASEGGMPLNGIEVGFVKNGTTKVSGISRNGEITVNLTPDVYELKVQPESLPAGYYVPDDADYKTSAEKGEAEISLPSKVISMTAPSNKRYTMGEVMHDFSYTPSTSSDRKLLSELVANYKAVMLNFWYVGCPPCRAEFPAIEQAYNQFKDKIAIVALDATDTATAIKNFQAEEGYTFDMAYDSAGIANLFGVESWPVTVIVDRYGVIAYRSSGNQTSTSVWTSLFAKYTADDYGQNPVEVDTNPGEDGDIVYQAPPADMQAPDYRAVLTGGAVLGEGAQGKVTDIHVETGENDKATSWPWYVKTEGDKSYLEASNSNQTPTFAILYMDFSLKSGDILSYDISYKTAASDAVYVILNSESRLANYSGGSSGGTFGWDTENGIYVANRDINITLSFTYIKFNVANDPKVEDDFVRIGNITVVSVEDITYPIDFARSAYNLGITTEDLVLGDDGLYRVKAPNTAYDGALLLVDLRNSTEWSLNHAGGTTFNPSGESTTTVVSAMYYFSFWEFSNYKTRPENDTGVTYDYTEYSYHLNSLAGSQPYSKNGYIPVTPLLRDILEDFCLAFKDSKFNAGHYYEGEWIEMCYVYEHHNGEHENGEFCNKTDDPIYGLTIFDAKPAHMTDANHVNIDVAFQNVAGHYYSFTAPKDGVYKIYSNVSSSNIDPDMFLYTWDGKNAILTESRSTNPGNAEMGRNFVTYRYLSQNDVLYMLMCIDMYALGEFDFYIEYAGESYEWLRTAAFDGMWIGDVDENGNFIGSHYGAIPWALREDGYYYTYSVDKDGNFLEWGSVIYIDFININYHDIGAETPRTLLQLIDEGLFNLNDKFLKDYTGIMTSYYYKSLEGKDGNDELYGKIEASAELVSVLATMLEYRTMDGDALETGFWLSMAYYYEHIGA